MQHTLSNTATGDPAGTFAYAAPEMLMGEKWDDKVAALPPPHPLSAGSFWGSCGLCCISGYGKSCCSCGICSGAFTL